MFAKFGSSPKEHPQSHRGAGWSSQHLVWSLSPCDVIWTIRSSRVSSLTFSLSFLMQLACSAAQLPFLWFPIASWHLHSVKKTEESHWNAMGLTASEGTAKEHDWRGSCHLHQANILDAKARGRQKLSAYTYKHLRLVTHLLAVFSLKALHVKFW